MPVRAEIVESVRAFSDYNSMEKWKFNEESGEKQQPVHVSKGKVLSTKQLTSRAPWRIDYTRQEAAPLWLVFSAKRRGTNVALICTKR